jgi:hypothetical protein
MAVLLLSRVRAGFESQLGLGSMQGIHRRNRGAKWGERRRRVIGWLDKRTDDGRRCLAVEGIERCKLKV